MPEITGKRRKYFLFLLLFGLSLFISLTLYPFVYAESSALPAVNYSSSTGLISIGSSNGTPASQVITIPELATKLSDLGHGDLLVDQGNGVWLLKASVEIKRSARLDATDATITWLRLNSPPVDPVTITATSGGYLLIDGIKLTSWDSSINAVDESLANGRSYLLAYLGGRMDILNSEIAYLGASSGEPSGLSWRKRLDDNDPTTGATGRLEHSLIHHNYFGMYSYEAYGLTILYNEVYENIAYGIDPHDNSQNFEVAYNKVYRNGTHGIIFSRLCVNNEIHHNEVYDNAQHGIMLDRGTNNNSIHDNTVYNNQDGIAIFQSSDNEIRDNVIHDNARGIRVNATYDAGDVYDGVSANNRFIHNTIEDSSEYGVYLYARADRNIFQDNIIKRSGVNGFYIKTGGNRLENNTVQDGTIGITIVGGEHSNDPPEALPALEVTGSNNVILKSTISGNSDVGLRILGGSENKVGVLDPADQGNLIENNGKDGIAIGDAFDGTAATDNVIVTNTIRLNQRHGILVTDATTVRNLISHNSITANGQLGIKVTNGAQGNIEPPLITTISNGGYIQGTTLPNATVEVYSDPGDSGQRVLEVVNNGLTDAPVQAAANRQLMLVHSAADYEGQTLLGVTTANADGVWSYTLPANQNPDQVSVLAIDANGNTSAFSGGAKGGGTVVINITTDENGQKEIEVTTTDATEEKTVTLADIKNNLGAADADLLEDLGNNKWRLNANLFIGFNVTLNVSPDDGVEELQLRSEHSTNVVAASANAIDYSSFVYLRTHNGEIDLRNVKVYSWDPAANDYDKDYTNGRAYILAKYNAILNIYDSDIGYLGSDDGESYGISWRDVNDTVTPDELRTRVTGEVINSKIHDNYYGIYTFQASDMTFRGNEFYNNVRYGFDPHDYSHHFLVENNLAYNNGAHGFIISRACNNFTFRNNKSYNNSDPTSSLAHGFMLDLGSPNSKDPQVPSYENVLEGNEAYGNEGYGLRIFGANNNEVRDNDFYNNEIGISIEFSSTNNLIQANRLKSNQRYGLTVRETADQNMILTNEIDGNQDHGIYLRSDNNEVRGNKVLNSHVAGIALLPEDHISVHDNQILSNTITGSQANGLDMRRVTATVVRGNQIASNTGDGIYLKDGSTQNSVTQNTIPTNTNCGIRANGIQTVNNTWSANSIYGNQVSGICLEASANQDLSAPQLASVAGLTLSGQANPNVTVEIFGDAGQQGLLFLGRITAAANGAFSFSTTTAWPTANLTAIAIDSVGNASAFSTPLSVANPTGTVTPTPTGTVNTPTPTPTGTLVPADNDIYLPMIQNP
ncbi:MAG: right-handed parallel beta-helix repeat-containing protein [Caldilineaceae bacterium]